ncbi:MAG: acetate kinase [Gammaproteobacteria bacterium]|jgi:acetate kinase
MQESLVLVFNCGSSSIKFAVINPVTCDNKLNGLVQCIGAPEADLTWWQNSTKNERKLPNINYQNAISEIMSLLGETDNLLENLIAVGHRVVHGGEAFTQSVIIDDEVLNQIKACSHLAPLHNPANLVGIEGAQKAFPKLKQVAVFDTAFHQTMPEHAYIYAVPYEWYEKYDVRRYGFHGTSHRYVTQQAANILDKSLSKCAFISAHLGNGCSVTAVLNGKSVDTSMGITPLEGLVMGTRSGDVDPSLHAYLADRLGLEVHEITKILNKESGLLGVSGTVSDMRSIEQACEQGNKRAILAFEIFCYRLAKYIMAYTVPLKRLDALIFTGGIGENSPLVRSRTIEWLGILNFKLNHTANNRTIKGKSGIITKDDSLIAVVIPTNEELMIAQDTYKIIA